jgi:DNA-binding CsgD family transcriptional regulator/PAS domain-containing protein
MLRAPSMHIRELSPDARALALTDAIYEAALAPEAWNGALELLKDALCGSAINLRVETFGSADAVEQRWLGFDPAFQRAYAEHYYREDVCSSSWPVGRTATADALVPREVRRRAPFFHELCVPFQLDDMVGGLVESSERGSIAISILKARGNKPFDETHTALLDRMLPHLRRAVRIDAALSASEAERARDWEALERLPVGAFVVAADGKLRRANPAGARMLGNGLRVGAQGLMAETAPATRALRRHLDAARKPNEPSRIETGVSLPRVGRSSLFALAVPARASVGFWRASSDVLLLVTDPAARIEPPPDVLTRLFGLTQAEARVALLVGRGLSPKQAAEQLGVTWNTVRAQLRSIFAKTQTPGQTALVRCLTLLGLVAPDQG